MDLPWMIVIGYFVGGLLTLPHRTKLAYNNSAPTRKGAYNTPERTEVHRRADGEWCGWWTSIWWPLYYLVVYTTKVSHFVAFPDLRGKDKRERQAKAEAARAAAVKQRAIDIDEALRDAQDLQRQLRQLKRKSQQEWDNEFADMQGKRRPWSDATMARGYGGSGG